MTKAPAWEPPSEPNLENCARTGWAEWEMDQPKVISFDTETTGLEFHDVAFGASIAWHHDDVIGFPRVRGHWFEFERFDSREAVRRIIDHADVLVAHNAKFDLHKLAAEGITLRPDQQLHDTECMAHLTDEHRLKGLKSLAINVLGFDDTIEIPARRKNKETGKQEDYMKKVARSVHELQKARMWAKKEYDLDSITEVGYHMLPRGVLVPYAKLDAEWTFNLAGVLHPLILAHPELENLYTNTEMRLTRGSLYELERAGLKVDLEYVRGQIKVYRKRTLKAELAIEQIVGRPVRTGDMPEKEKPDYFNPASPKQVGEYLAAAGFDSESYDAEALQAMDHPLAHALLNYRGDKKLLESYFVALERDTGPDGLFHPALRQHGTVSGRTSAGAERGDQ